VLPYIALQLSTLGTLMTKKVIPQQLGEVFNDFNAAFLAVAQAESCEFEAIEKQVSTVKS
jgi:hypothetical protein